MICLAPSELMTPTASSAVGTAVEKIIEADYLADVKRLGFFPASFKDFADFSLGFGNSPLWLSFLALNNPKLSVQRLAVMSKNGLVKIPDICTSDLSDTEFYEIKPNSVDGRYEGGKKITEIIAFMTSLSLPYVPGMSYSPNKKIRIFAGSLLGTTFEVFLHFERILPGLVVYDFCVKGNLRELGLKTALAAIAAAIVASLLAPLTAPAAVLAL